MSKSSPALHRYSVLEEIFNASTHGVGVLLGVVGLILLTMKALNMADGAILAAALIYGISIILLFAASTLYHAIQHTPTKRVLRTVDHCAIYLLIAGTYTPFTLMVIGNPMGAIIMALVWGLAVAGIIFKIFFVGRFHTISLITYLGMGWLGLLAAFEIANNLPPTGIALLVGGGLAYSIGTIFFKVKAIPFNHAIWHLFVLAGCILHFLAVYYFVLPLA